MLLYAISNCVHNCSCLYTLFTASISSMLKLVNINHSLLFVILVISIRRLLQLVNTYLNDAKCFWYYIQLYEYSNKAQ